MLCDEQAGVDEVSRATWAMACVDMYACQTKAMEVVLSTAGLPKVSRALINSTMLRFIR
jgi:hypothetical protein